MAETTQFTLEGDVTLAYDSDSPHGKRVFIQDDGHPVPLEEYVARQLGFPNDGEYDAMITRLDGLRQKGLQPMGGEPDIVREGVKLRISVEVVE